MKHQNHNLTLNKNLINPVKSCLRNLFDKIEDVEERSKIKLLTTFWSCSQMSLIQAVLDLHHFIYVFQVVFKIVLTLLLNHKSIVSISGIAEFTCRWDYPKQTHMKIYEKICIELHRIYIAYFQTLKRNKYKDCLYFNINILQLT